jgi:hypothetical protein
MELAAPRDSEALMEVMDRTTAAIAARSAECLRAVADYDERKLWKRDGATSISSWLVGRYGLAWGTAREWIRVARALRRLPRIAEAYSEGKISWDQLRPLTRFAAPETDEFWARKAPERRPGGLWREARRHERARVKEAEEAHRDRYLWLTWDPELPVLWLEGMLPAEEGERLEAALSRRAGEVPPDPGATDPPAARMADALVDLAGGGPWDQAPAATVVVHAGAEILLREQKAKPPWLAETQGGRRLCSDAVRRLACDGKVEWVLESGGRPVGLGRRARAVRGQLFRVLHHRDQGTCRFPGCERRRWLHAHHLVHWADGGGTNLDNLVLLCHAHHRLLHEGGWRTSGHPARNLRFHDPHGRQLRTTPLARSGEKPALQLRL